MKLQLAAISFLGLLLNQGAFAATFTVTGGGTAGQSIFVTIDQDIQIAAKPGQSFGGYYFGFRMEGVLNSAASTATLYNGNWYDLANTVGTDAIYQSSPTDAGSVLDQTAISLYGTNLDVFYGTSSYTEFLVSDGAFVTFKAGTIELSPFIGNVVLQNPGASYEINDANLFSSTEQYVSANAGNAMIVPEPSMLVLGLSGFLGLALRRNRR